MEEDKFIPEPEDARSEPMPDRLPVLFPNMVVPIHVSREKSVAAIDAVFSGRKLIGLVTQRNEQVEEPASGDLFTVGTIGLILRKLVLPEGGARILVQGLSRIIIKKFVREDPYFEAEIEPVTDRKTDGLKVQALMRSCLEQFKEFVNLSRSLPTEILVAANNVREPAMLADLLGTHVNIKLEEKQQVLETFDVRERLKLVNSFLSREIQLLNMSNEIQSQVQEEVGKTQREFFLREQLKAIQKELGELDSKEAEKAKYEEKIAAAKMPQEVEKKAREELERLARLHPESAEGGVIRTYLDTLCDLPWSTSTPDTTDIKKSERILDEDHYGLEEVKERLLEFVGVIRMTKRMKGPILCFVGPPGTGKTSLGKSIARALGRKFVRMSLGGIRDEAEIRGHRRTYVGALPGRIIQGIRNAKTNNPVFMLDEIDKVGMDFRGDPSSALLEALDPEQNHSFSDHYLEVPFDLSRVLFIATANILDTVPPALQDRMEVIRLSGYTELEKIEIARRFLVPKQLEAHGLKPAQLTITRPMLRKLILDYTREAGVRNLERELAKICRKVALKIAADEIKREHITSSKKLQEYLGVRRFDREEEKLRSQVGVATGVAWTSVGGDIQVIEASRMPGQGNLILTGHLGEVMKESCQAAMTYLRSNAETLGVDPAEIKKYDVHIHFPAGAIPKDGPSAGVTVAVALISLFTGVKVRGNIAMTGEVSLKGRVLPVGGLKEKLLGAKRVGIHQMILPARNEKDLSEVPEEITRGMKFFFIGHLDDVLPLAFVRDPRTKRAHKQVKAVKKHQPSPKKLASRGDGKVSRSNAAKKLVEKRKRPAGSRAGARKSSRKK
ncbi:MAG: endopeptidase La [Planctomycetales bacterium 4484_113]|nr:MAG: endopeptidase La [Planctomycetales bacterium 4484_113]